MSFPVIDPVFLRLGPLQFRWYGLMYVIGFVISYFLIRKEAQRRNLALDSEAVADLIFCLALGVVVGGRFGYVLFYDFATYLRHPLQIFAIWQGGMSFHGGLLGVAVAAIWYARRVQLSYLQLADLAALAAPVGLGLGRIGNFINGELFGRPTSMPWGMIFPAGGPLPRHPSQLYEAFLEGLVLFVVVRLLARRFSAPGTAMAAFLSGYGLFRFVVELFRQPDSQLGLFFGFFSMGQLLSLPLFLAGGVLLVWLNRRKSASPAERLKV
jgi:phosphatidylglycerol:prolipoprotein diacylglycerol transferase